ncbi:MAG: C25 family cysteine peptidase [Anaerolineae bacterium]|nr:C25 family cysteine peptidase [Anaerolineae bacterium]
MTNLGKKNLSADKTLSRLEFLELIQAGMKSEEYRFTRNIASIWLAKYPGDIPIETLFAQALLKDKRHDLALPVLKRITNTDPLHLPAHRLIVFANSPQPFATVAQSKTSLFALGGKGISSSEIEEWGNLLVQAGALIKEDKFYQAESFVHQALVLEPETPLAAVLHIYIAVNTYDWAATKKLAQQYTARWPDTIAFQLVLADCMMKGGEEEPALQMLHQASALDIAGQVPRRLWGENYPYQNIWTELSPIECSLPIPAAVSAVLGRNQLPQGELTAPKGDSDQLGENKNSRRQLKADKQTFQENVLLDQSSANQSDGRFPVYVVLTSRTGLEAQYGAEALPEIDQLLNKVVSSSRSASRWDACLVYADDGESLDRFGIPPAKPKDPWSTKLLLHDLDNALAKRGERIGALLIVGGPKVIPFHKLPNPVDDVDADVPSDNPYACLDENYFIPRWPVGRLPGSANNDPASLIKQLNTILSHRTHQEADKSFFKRVWEKILSFLFKSRRLKKSIGLTAEIWRRASHAVYRPIGKPQSLVVSPPSEAQQIPFHSDAPAQLAYFNLHGLEDAPDWYGQRDPFTKSIGPDYPIALRPQDIVNSGRAPQIVFSEACYGANVIDKNVEDAISLKFLDSGSLAMVGSTVTSYGSIASPLIAADLLGKAFWNYLKEGFPVGEALRRAKIYLAREMNKRQGYLDGEDQKTLISFILYGDPLSQPHTAGHNSKNLLALSEGSCNVKMVCDKINTSNMPEYPEVSEETLAHVKGIVKEYLPGMSGAKVLVSQEHTHCQGHSCPTHQIGAKSLPEATPSRQVITLSKNIPVGDQSHPHYARITLNNEGEVVKLAVSR